MKIKASVFSTTLLHEISDASINTNTTDANLVNSNPFEKTDLQINNLCDLQTKKDNMNNASSYFKLNGRPSVIKHLFLEFKFLNMTTMKNLHF